MVLLDFEHVMHSKMHQDVHEGNRHPSQKTKDSCFPPKDKYLPIVPILKAFVRQNQDNALPKLTGRCINPERNINDQTNFGCRCSFTLFHLTTCSMLAIQFVTLRITNCIGNYCRYNNKTMEAIQIKFIFRCLRRIVSFRIRFRCVCP